MKGLSSKEIVLPIVIVLVAIVIVSIFSVHVLRGLKEECETVQGQLQACSLDLGDRTEKLRALYEELNLTEQDIKVYDEIYQQKQTEAQQLEEQLQEEKSKPEDQRTCIVPFRSVPNYAAFSKVWRMEMIIERIDLVEKEIDSSEFIRDDDLHRVIGQLHFISYDFWNLYQNNGYTDLPKDESVQKWYSKNNDLMSELEGMYLNFAEYDLPKTKTRLSQIVDAQREIVQSVQERYFI